MNFETWEPVYDAIRAEFGYERRADERARDRLGAHVRQFDVDRIHATDATVAIVGGAADRSLETARVDDADVVFAASQAATALRDAQISVDCMITDLDKVPEHAVGLTNRGTPVVVHAHGDNIPEIDEWVPQMDTEHVLATTQVRPRGPVRNFGGFTDGDRAAFLADHLGASALTFPGWDFADPNVSAIKRRKLTWAARLLRWLERRRDEEFPILDGRRETIDLSMVPD